MTDWIGLSIQVYKKGQSRHYSLRRLQSFDVCTSLLCMFYLSVVSSALFYAVVFWRNGISAKASSVIVIQLDPLDAVWEERTLCRLLAIMDNTHPLHHTSDKQRSTFSNRPIVTAIRPGLSNFIGKGPVWVQVFNPDKSKPHLSLL